MIPKTYHLNHYLSQSGVCSRRKAVDLIASGAVSVNGAPMSEPFYQVQEQDRVAVHGKLIVPQRYCYVMFNKPKDCITTCDEQYGRRAVLDMVSVDVRVFPVGRLDRNSTGLLLLTNDGELAQKLAHPRNNITKEYRVRLHRELEYIDKEELLQGITLEDGVTHFDHIQLLDSGRQVVKVVLHSGKNRIIRRAFEALGYEVVALERVKFGVLALDGGLRAGEWRLLTTDEVRQLHNQTTDITKKDSSPVQLLRL